MNIMLRGLTLISKTYVPLLFRSLFRMECDACPLQLRISGALPKQSLNLLNNNGFDDINNVYLK